MNILITPVQALLSLAFEIWIVVFPIIIIRKLNRLTELLEGDSGSENPDS